MEDNDGSRKAVEDGGGCSVCCVAFDERENAVWYKAACRNNVHEKCFEMWALQKSPVKCPFCPAEWVSGEAAGDG